MKAQQKNASCGCSGFLRRECIALFASLLFAASPMLLGGCAKGPVARLLPNMGSMQVAQHYFGPPTSSVSLGDGTVRHE